MDEKKNELEYVYPGIEQEETQAGKCDDECVGGTASTANMEATKP